VENRAVASLIGLATGDEEAILSAANLGDDADTTAAICGQIAGAYYGSDGIPDSWKEKLYRYAEIEKLGSDLYSVNRS